jgi:HEAT repeat protein
MQEEQHEVLTFEEVSSTLVKEYSKYGIFVPGEKPHYPPLDAALDIKSSRLRLAAVIELGRRKDRRSLPLLKSALSDWYVPVRAEAIRAMEAMGDNSAKEEFIARALSRNFNESYDALRVLAELRDKSMDGIFMTCMWSEDARISALASQVVFSMGDRSGLESLISKLENGSDQETIEAASFLVEIEDPDAQRAVADFLNSDSVSPTLKQAVASELRRARRRRK